MATNRMAQSVHTWFVTMNLLPSVVDTPPRQLPAHPIPHSLQAFFEPETVAVIGASRARGTIGAEIFHNLLTTGFHGCVFPVNPHAISVQGVRAYTSLREVPADVDLGQERE